MSEPVPSPETELPAAYQQTNELPSKMIEL